MPIGVPTRNAGSRSSSASGSPRFRFRPAMPTPLVQAGAVIAAAFAFFVGDGDSGGALTDLAGLLLLSAVDFLEALILPSEVCF